MTYEVKERREREGKKDIKIDGGEGVPRGREGGGGRGEGRGPRKVGPVSVLLRPAWGLHVLVATVTPSHTRAGAVPLMHLSTWAR